MKGFTSLLSLQLGKHQKQIIKKAVFFHELNIDSMTGFKPVPQISVLDYYSKLTDCTHCTPLFVDGLQVAEQSWAHDNEFLNVATSDNAIIYYRAFVTR